ncbi:MAG: hypothetical protein UV54_C0009G0003 [Candidatus Beckwithbacteria bacterium GW2011_GWA2_43_10]|uniref:DUF4956 domain-containing protein n=1 Tax=Candidatus Beckwithbacteria bacterium GW2011_GWA2_43_10 TaxID=1618369 RepID=A0A0G1C448_9BACT|nr:MAG: hypothetical protein UV54_C0009G0003 [Candidatus Beckwithbacteria bacterium GW2011_GWA2_43_10]
MVALDLFEISQYYKLYMDSILGTINTQIINIPLGAFVLNLLLAAILSMFLGAYYTRYGNSFSNRKIFAKNFILIALVTTVVIAIIKSSLALSLGLVGALSIVRFRSAIKEPEELAFLFFAIMIGLGMGADQRFITIIATVIILGILRLRDMKVSPKIEPNLFLSLSLARGDNKADLPQIIETLKKYCEEVNMQRFDETEKNIEASFFVKYAELEKIQQTKNDLRRLAPDIEINFVDNKTSY